MSSVVVEQLRKDFSDVTVLRNIDLDIKEGEFFALLGPSGCGKTTTMRCIAGFEEPTNGIVKIGGNVVNDVERSEEHTSELQSRGHLVCRLLLEKKKKNTIYNKYDTKMYTECI